LFCGCVRNCGNMWVFCWWGCEGRGGVGDGVGVLDFNFLNFFEFNVG